MAASHPLRPFDPVRDLDAAHALWEAALATTWPIRRGTLAEVATGGWVVELDDEVVGVALTNRQALVALVVDPARRRCGIGSALLEAAQPASLATGGEWWVWPGVPENLPGALDFFVACGWSYTGTVWDFVADLRAYESPRDLRPTLGITYRRATVGDLPAILAFEKRHFPEWVRWYERIEPRRVLVAADETDAVVGALTLEWPAVSGPGQWSRILGDDLGGLGAVGVDPDRRGRGIGTAMVVRASELLRDLGAGTCLIHWLVRTDFYGRAGYRPWRSYRTATRGPGK